MPPGIGFEIIRPILKDLKTHSPKSSLPDAGGNPSRNRLSQGGKEGSDADLNVVYFDGQCAVCTRSFQILLRLDRKNKLTFCLLQSESARQRLPEELLRVRPFSSMIFETGNRILVGSAAALAVCSLLGGFAKLALILKVFPPGFREFCYKIFADNRYRWQGRRRSCFRPSDAMKSRFLP